MDSEDDKQCLECLEEENNVPELNIIPVQLIEINNRENEVHVSSPSPTTISSVVRGKLKYYKQTYRPAWEQMPDFKGWLRGVEGEPTRAYCTYCQKTLHAHRLSLLKHTCTIRHQKAAQIHKTRRFITVNKTYQKPVQPQTEATTDSEQSTADVSPRIIINDVTEDQEISVATTEGDAEETQVVVEYSEAAEMEEAEHEDTEADERDEYDEDEDDEEAMVAEYVDVRKRISNQVGNGKPPISTHVVDTTRGVPISGLSVSLYKLIDGRWTYINEGTTNASGKFAQFISRTDFAAGRYKLHYDVDRYFEARKQESIYPFIEGLAKPRLESLALEGNLSVFVLVSSRDKSHGLTKALDIILMIVFDCTFADSYHIPILLSPYGYTTYRGS